MKLTVFKRPLFIFAAVYAVFLLLFPSQKTDIPKLEHFLGADVTLTGRAVLLPQKGKTVKTILNVSEINGEKIKTRVYVYLPAGDKTDYRETLEVSGVLREPYPMALEGSFNWKKYLNNKNVYTELSARDVKTVKKAPLFFLATNYIRNDMLSVFEKNFDRESAVILSGIILGEKQGLSGEMHRAFNDSGAMHLLVASGANVAFAALIIHFLCSVVGIKRKWRLPMALVFAGIYTVLAGMDPPLVRAYIMTLAAGIGMMLKRNSGPMHGLVTAAVLILLFSPKSIRDISFIMSFLATFIIILSAGFLKLPDKWPSLLKGGVQIFFITLCVQLVLVPVYTNIFFRFSLAAVIANVFLVPLAEICMALGFLLYAVKLTHIGLLFKIVWGVLYGGIWLFQALVSFFSASDFSAVTVPALSASAITVFYVSLILIFLVKKKYAFIPLIFLLLSPFINILFQRDFLALIDKNRENAVVWRAGGKAVVFTDNLDGETLHKFLLAKGEKNAALCLGKINYDFCSAYQEPFADFWPGEEIFFKKNKIKTSWGLMPRREGFWINYGYSGTEKDAVSYSFGFKKQEVTLGGKQDFISYGDERLRARRNASVYFQAKR